MMKGQVSNVTAYVNLANAIVAQAAEDYRNSLRYLNKHPEDKYSSKAFQCGSTCLSIVHFMHSGWFNFLTDVDGDYILDQIYREEIARV